MSYPDAPTDPKARRRYFRIRNHQIQFGEMPTEEHLAFMEKETIKIPDMPKPTPKVK